MTWRGGKGQRIIERNRPLFSHTKAWEKTSRTFREASIRNQRRRIFRKERGEAFAAGKKK